MNTQRIIKNSLGLGLAIALSVVFEAFTRTNYNERPSNLKNDAITCGTEDTIQKSTENEVYSALGNIPEGFPTYPNGQVALRRFISRNIHYPDSANKYAIDGQVIVNFVIDETGSVCNVRVTQNANPYLDEEAVRVVKKMPKWILGSKQKGNVEYYIPFNFSLH